MRIRTQIVGALAAASVVAALVAAVLFQVTRHAADATRAQAGSEEVARAVAQLVTLSLETTTFGSARAARQWHGSYAQLQATLRTAAADGGPPLPSLAELRRNVEELNAIFEQVEHLPAGAPDEQSRHRKLFLVERLVTELQEVVEARYLWSQEIGATRAADQRAFTGLVLGAPGLLLALLAALAAAVALRVLRPLRRLQVAVTSIRDGDLSVRCDTGVADELGDAARAVDAMAAALQRQGAELAATNRALSHEVARRRESEQRLQLITDNVPALVADLDQDQRFRYANLAHLDWLDASPDALRGLPLAACYGESAHRAVRPHLEASLAGAPGRFEHELPTRRGPRHFEVATVPQRDGDGAVTGLYMLSIDITERRQVAIEREARQAALEASLAEKEVLLKEIHHRVKNNLQVITSLLQLQMGCIDDAATRRVFQECQGRIESMALVHEKLYQARDMAQIDFGEYLRDLVSGLSGSWGGHAAGVRIDVQAAAVPLDVDRAVPAGLLVNELVSNSFKHAFPDGRAGRVSIVLAGGGTAPVVLSVRDDGVGWPAGFDPSRTKSLGLRLVHILAKQLRAGLRFDSRPGTACTLTLQPGS